MRKHVSLGLAVALLAACGDYQAEQATPDESTEPATETTEGEEPAGQLARAAQLTMERSGTRLLLSFDAEANAFVGTVENVADTTLPQVRVEVHLSNGVELGPTTPVDLAPGAQAEVRLAAPSEDFETWSAHAEVGADEHGAEHEGDEGGEHGEAQDEHEGEEGEHRENRGENEGSEDGS